MTPPQHFRSPVVTDGMSMHAQLAGKARQGDYIVRRPRSTDALGHALRGVFGDTPLPDEFMVLLHRLDRVTH